MKVTTEMVRRCLNEPVLCTEAKAVRELFYSVLNT
jgi:hypothetical protein